jgi:hypothetical protein
MFGGYGGNGRLDDFYEFDFGRTSSFCFSASLKIIVNVRLFRKKNMARSGIHWNFTRRKGKQRE